MPTRRAIAILCGLFGACGGVSEVGNAPSWRQPPSEIQASAQTPAGAEEGEGGEPETIELAADERGASHYNADERPPPRDTARATVAMEAVAEAAEDVGREMPARDGRLDAACAALAEVAPARAPVPYRLIEFALQQEGIIEPSPHLVVTWGPPGDESGLSRKLEKRLPAILESADFARVGVGAARRSSGEVATVIALQTSVIETEPIPRVLPEGGTLRLEGRVSAPYGHPDVYLTRADGSVSSTPLRRIAGSGFRADVGCDEGRGMQQVEITARDQSGSTVLANFPIWCFEEPPSSVQVTVGGEVPSSPAEAEARFVELMNRERKRHDLSPLELDPRVGEVARAHAREMAETGVVAHVSPTTGSAATRIRDAGIQTPIVLENVARAYSVTEAHEGLMNSPGHRASILHEAVNRVGVGVVLGERVAGRRELFVGQVFTRRAEQSNPRATLERIHAAVQSQRPLAADPGLSSVAQRFARDLAEGVPRHEAAADATRRLEERGVTFADVSSLVASVPHAGAFSPERALEREDATHYGLGVARATGQGDGGGALTVVLLVATR